MASFTDTFVKPISITGDVLWICAFFAYLVSEPIEGRRILASEKMFSYGASSLLGLLAIDRFGRESGMIFAEKVLVPIYGFITFILIMSLAIKLKRTAPGKIGSAKVYIYSALFGGSLLALSTLKLCVTR